MDNQDVLYKNRYQAIMVALCLVSVVFSVFVFTNCLQGRFLEASIELGLLLLSSLSAWKLKAILASPYAQVFTVGFTCLVAIVWLFISSLQNTSITAFVWIFGMPIVAYPANGMRHGFILTMLITAITMVVYCMRYPTQGYEFTLIDWMNVSLCMSTIWMAVHFYEKSNFYSKKDLIKLAAHDRLTGLKTRDQLYKIYQQYPNNEHSLILIDIDHLSKINAAHGYTIGDMVLMSTAQIIMENLQENEHAFRIGGDEFAILLPNSHREQNLALVQRISVDVNAYQAEFKNDIIKVQVSMAVASMVSDGNNLDTLIKKADELMQQVKPVKHDN